MGKASSAAAATPTTEMKRKKKKGRPSLTDLQKRQQQHHQHKQITNNKKTLTPPPPVNYNFTPARRSARRNSNLPSNSPPPFDQGDNDDDDDDDERKQKKVKLVVRLPQSNYVNQQKDRISQHSDSDSRSGSEDSDADLDLGGDDHLLASPKKRKINAVDRRSDDAVSLQGEKVSKATDTRYGLQVEPGPTTTLPDKKILLFILDRLQKKDTYGVFSEPVDSDELPDYHEIIEHPMDFGTVRKKLDDGIYSNLEELEADVLLICSNAMQYNAPDTVYFRQARSIQELAKRDFANLRHEGDDGEPQPKLVRRGRPPSKNLRKSLESSPVDRIGQEISSSATLASGEDKAVGSNSYTLRKGPATYRFRSSDAVPSHRSRNGESDWSIDWSSEFPANILRADMKYGKKNFLVDENKRDTYKEYHPSDFDSELSAFSIIDADMKRLLAVGLHFERHGYARSLAKYAADLGPVAWRIASRKIETLLPPGVKFGPGWVGENEVRSELSSFPAEKQKSPSNVASDCHSCRPPTPSAPGMNSSVQSRPSEEMVEAVRRLNSQNELAVQASASPWGIQGSSFQAQKKSAFHPNRNGFNGMIGYSLSQLGMAGPSMPSGQSGLVEGSMPSRMLAVVSRNDASSIHPTSSDHPDSEEPKSLEGWGLSHPSNLLVRGKGPDSIVEPEVGHSRKSPYQELSGQHRQTLPIPPDLNVRVQAPGSPSYSLRVGSPQQPDLALQL